MNRSVDQVNVQIISTLVSNFATIGITIDPSQWSKRNYMRLFCYTFAVCTAYLEQLWESLKSSLETLAAQSAAASNLWIQAQMFLFQYSDTDPQVLQLVNTVADYPIIDPSLRIISACSVNSTASNEVTIKVAKGNPFTALSTNEKNAAQGYINQIGTSGINYTVQSLNSDKLYVNANIYYQGQYSAVIQANVIAALNSFMQNLSVTNFNGTLKMTDLESVIRNVTGVNDVVLLNVRGRDDASSYSAGIQLIGDSKTFLRMWQTISGYVSGEDTTGYTFADSLNFLPE